MRVWDGPYPILYPHIMDTTYPTPRHGLSPAELDIVRHVASDTIRRHVDTLTREEWRAGMAWYADANLWCRAVAGQYGLGVDQVTWIVALLSPQNSWTQNRRDTLDLIEHGECGALALGVGRAEWVLAGTPGEDVAGGRKVRSFGRNLTHPWSSLDVTLDSHMAMILGLPSVRYLERRRVYGALADAFRTVAGEHGILPMQLQASLWCARRGSGK